MRGELASRIKKGLPFMGFNERSESMATETLGDELIRAYQTHRYVWRGKEYKTIGGLHNAMLRSYPSTSLSFGPDYCYLRAQEDRWQFKVERQDQPDGSRRSIISDQPAGA